MANHTATIRWTRAGAAFIDNRYSRAHEWQFDGGAHVPASSSPHSVPIPLSDPAGVDPEEAFVAALSSCHMLTFLSIAAKRGFLIESYTDQAVGHMEMNVQGRLSVTRVILRPDIRFGGDSPATAEQLGEMHDKAHRECYLANSVRTVVTVAPPERP
jgi:organic hydroperoxide reductase OsmC/OhrA